VLRLKESCPGAHEIVNVRLETMPLTGNQRQINGVEVLAYGTAIYYMEQSTAP
jgi:uncharacterized protein YbjQ (UPF0145 family)